MKAPALAEAAVDLAWLSPCAESLAVLVRLPATLVWSQVRADPGMVLLLARHGSKTSPIEALRDPALLARALHFFQLPEFVDWKQPHLMPIYEACVSQARLAHALACQVPDADPDSAWMGGLLAPLGWLAACAVDPVAASSILQNPDFAADPAHVQQQTWGLEHSAIARRLCRRWGLPAWLATIIGHLGLPVDIARNLGAEATLFQIVQLAVCLVQERGQNLGLVVGSSICELMSCLDLSGDSLQAAWDQSMQKGPALGDDWQAPTSVPLLSEFLRLALESRHREDPTLLEQLQAEVDLLQGALQDQCATEKERLGKLKLSAMSELAAGAGHEINNPLAVISGQAQYLASHETDPERAKALQTIIGQTRRIHVILNEMMQFARPPVPQPELIDPRELIQDVTAGLGELAGRLQVQLLCPEPGPIVGRLVADPVQIRIILSCLLRNAIEAAPAEGWAGVRVQAVGEFLEFIVEDNGSGPTPAAREHMFDPFFSGRSAGRGRGLGLSTAWRLAQLNGGQVRFEDSSPGLTRFVCRFPLLPALENAADPLVPPHLNGCVVQGVISEVA